MQIDFYGPFKFQNKKKFLIVSIDRFTKWVNIKPVDFTGTKQVIKFLKQVFVDSGIPDVIKSDNATCFNSTEYLKFLKRRSIKPEYVTPYVHTGNGSIERTIGTIDSYFKIYLDETKNMQDSVFKMLELLRFTYHQSIKQTPFEKHFGRKPDTQLSVQFKNIREILENPNCEITYLLTDMQKNTFGQFRYKAKSHANHETIEEWTGTGNSSRGPVDLVPNVSVKYFLRKNHSKKNLDSKYVNTVYNTEKETEHTVTALGKTYHKNDIAPLTESQYKALNLQDQSTPSASSSQQQGKKRGRQTNKDTGGPSPGPKSPKPKSSRSRSNARNKGPNPDTYKLGQWHLGNDGNAYDTNNRVIKAPGKKCMFTNEKGKMEPKETATRVALVPDTKALLKGGSLKPTTKKSQTTKPKKTKGRTNFDRDTSDEEEDMDMDITGSLSENETEEGEQTEEGDEETAGNEGSRAVDLLIGDRTGCPVQQAATSRLSSEATHILDNTLTKSEDQLVLEGKKTTEAKETPELLPAAFTDAGLENLRKEVNEANRSRPMPKPISGGGIQQGPTSAFKPLESKDKGKHTSTGTFNLPDPGNRQAPKSKPKNKPKTETIELRRSKRIPKAKPTEKFGAVKYC